MEKAALVVVDVQDGLIDGFEDDWADVLPVVSRLVRSARRVGAPVVLVQHCGAHPDHPLHRDAEGWRLHASLDPQPSDLVITKTWSDAFRSTDLAAVLGQEAVTRVVLVGAQSEFCIDTTARRAASLGYDVDVVADGHTTSDNGILTREQIIAHTNASLTGLAVVDVVVRTPSAADVDLVRALRRETAQEA